MFMKLNKKFKEKKRKLQINVKIKLKINSKKELIWKMKMMKLI